MDLVPIIQAHVARVAITPSAARRQGAKGVVQAARRFLAESDLRPFGTSDRARFGDALDLETDRLGSSLPAPAGTWGLSRKLLNIFLRDALYTHYLCDHYGLAPSEHLLELPLDSITAGKLRKIAGRGRLPPWTAVKRLTPTASAEYQAAALHVAKEFGVARVHLDALWWARPEELRTHPADSKSA